MKPIEVRGRILRELTVQQLGELYAQLMDEEAGVAGHEDGAATLSNEIALVEDELGIRP